MSIRPQGQVPYTTVVGQTIRWHRERLGLQQVQLAQALGVLQPAYSRIEQGGTSVTVAQLRVIGRTMKIAPSQLLHDVEQQVQQLRRQGVVVTDAKEVPKAALAIGLGILAAALIASSN